MKRQTVPKQKKKKQKDIYLNKVPSISVWKQAFSRG